MNTRPSSLRRTLVALAVAATASAGFALAPAPALAAVDIGLSVNLAPPPLPVYVQPAIPAPGYIWTPGYWRWDPTVTDYYWVPGTWVQPPSVGVLWTPGYWGWGPSGYVWRAGYWGPHIGFYGGVNYGYGYGGTGYHGGYWRDGVFNYNRTVNNINVTVVHNTYEERVVENNTSRTSFNGGHDGIQARPTPEQMQARAEPHVAPTAVQRQHEQMAMRNPEQRASVNHGAPKLAAVAAAEPRGMAHPGGPSGPAQPGHVPAPPRSAQAEPRMPGERPMAAERAPHAERMQAQERAPQPPRERPQEAPHGAPHEAPHEGGHEPPHGEHRGGGEKRE